MIKQITRLEHKIADKLFHFTCENESSIEHVKESLFQFLKYIGQVEDNIKSQQEKIEQEKKEKEEQEKIQEEKPNE